MEDAGRLASTDPDYAIRDLYDAIAKGDYPSWSFYIQVMTFEEAEKFPFNPFDVTKVCLTLLGIFSFRSCLSVFFIVEP